MKYLLLFLLATQAHALDHDSIVKQMKKPKLKNEIMAKSSHAVTVKLDDLIPLEERKKLDKQKLVIPTPSISPTPHSSIFDSVSNVYMKKAYAFSPAPKPIPVLPKYVNLQSKDTPVVTQWNGTCTAHASMAAAENLLNKTINLSERHHWSHYGQYSSYASVDSFIKNPVTKDMYWPNHADTAPQMPQKPFVKLKSVEYIGFEIEKLKAHLASNKPAIVAMAAPNDLMSCLPVVRENSGIAKDAGHAMAVVGYGLDSTLKSGGYFIVKNSWGTNCHDKGYAAIPFSVCYEKDGYCTFWNFKEVEVIN